ncbi:MAG: M48 family metallopeptidase [Parcubacteria group bacterium]|nr:M48 family metallopeptidase [Parcubacteria group bacterium]
MEDIKIDKIIRSRRRTLALIVTADATLVVRAPLRVSLKYINNFVLKKQNWIKAKQQQVNENGGPVRSKEFIDGESFLYLGEIYRLKIEDCDRIELSQSLLFPKRYLLDAKGKMIEWYKDMARETIKARADIYSRSTGWEYKTIKITSAQTRWGSCSPKGSINFPWRLVMAPINAIDYVVVHELAHIHEKNHSARFWNKVETVLPDYKQRELWLKENRKFLNL